MENVDYPLNISLSSNAVDTFYHFTDFSVKTKKTYYLCDRFVIFTISVVIILNVLLLIYIAILKYSTYIH